MAACARIINRAQQRGGGGVIGVAAAVVWGGGARRFSGLCLATVKLFAV